MFHVLHVLLKRSYRCVCGKQDLELEQKSLSIFAERMFLLIFPATILFL